MLEIDAAGQVGKLRVDVHLTTPSEGPLVLVGPSGAGKSSLLLMILGFLPIARGAIHLHGRPLVDTARRIDLPPEERSLGYVPQEYALFPHMTAVDNVRFGLQGASHSAQSRRNEKARALAILEELEVGYMAHRRPGVLSGGERQRVALARALARGPGALLLDEPLAALDARTRRQVRGLLARRLQALALPAVVVTHEPVDAEVLGGKIAVLEAGRVVQQGTFDQLRASPATEFVADFVSNRSSG